MPEPLSRLLERLDAESPGIASDDVATWPDGEFDQLRDAGLIREEKRAQWIDCDGCEDRHRGRVQWLSGDPPRAFVSCPENGRVEVEPERLRRWGVDLARLVEKLAAALSAAGRVEELVPSRLWLLGRMVIAGRSREVFFARRLGSSDGAAVVDGCARLRAAVAPFVLVAEIAPPRDNWNADAPPVVALTGMVALKGDALVVDRSYLESALGVKTVKKKRTPAPAIFPTPRGATWSDVDIRFRDGESLSVRVRDERRRVTYVEMGMVDGRTSRPDKQWELLRDYAAEGGALTWGRNADARHRNTKRTERLAAALRGYFNIAGDPIEYVERTKGWRTRFSLRGE